MGVPKDRQGRLFDEETLEPHHFKVDPLSDLAKKLLFSPKTQWSLGFGTASAVTFNEFRKLHEQEKEPPVCDVRLSIAMPLHAHLADAVNVVKEVLPDYDHATDKLVFLRDDRLVTTKRMARGYEADYGRSGKQTQYVNGVTFETTDPAKAARFLRATRQAPKTLKIALEYNQDWFNGELPQPNDRFKSVLQACAMDTGVLKKCTFSEKSSHSHENGIKTYIESLSPAAAVNPRP